VKLVIKLLSDLCVSSGDFSNGVVDTEITTDDFGIPVIPGKRVKGLFREAAEEWLEYSPKDRETADEIFGKVGENGSCAVFGTLYPKKYRELRNFLSIAKCDDKWKAYAGPRQVQKFYTSVRTQTAMDENGIANENTLRSSRVIRKEVGTFEGQILLADPLNQKQKDLLDIWAKMIRHMGMNRTRGFGNVVCRLEPDKNKEANGKELALAPEEEMEALPVYLDLEQPCVIDKSYITGTILRGAFAARFAENERMLGNPTDSLHQNPLFHQLFLSGNVEYGFCWPYVNDRLHLPAPKSFLRKKKSTGNELYDLAGCKPEEIEDFLDQKERCRSGFLYWETERDRLEAFQTSPERMVTNHHRRPEDRSIGHAMKDSENPQSADGQLYSLETLKEGQTFCGEIRGKKGLLRMLQELLPEGTCISVGNSRSSQYGKARLRYEKKVEKERVKLDGKTVITLTAPMVIEDDYGNDMVDETRAVETILKSRVTEKMKILSYCGEEMMSGYHGKWRMPLIQRRTLAAGTVFVIYGLELNDEQVKEAESHSYGKYTEEGYGRVAVNLHGSVKSGTCDEEKEKETELKIQRYQDYGPKDFVDACLKERIADACKKTDCMTKIRRNLNTVPNANVLSGLGQIAKTSKSFEDFTGQLENAVRRAKKTNSEWYQGILDHLLIKETSVEEDGEVKNRFYQESLRKIDLRGEWLQQWSKNLDEEGFSYFKEILERMIYEVHLVKRNRGEE